MGQQRLRTARRRTPARQLTLWVYAEGPFSRARGAGGSRRAGPNLHHLLHDSRRRETSVFPERSLRPRCPSAGKAQGSVTGSDGPVQNQPDVLASVYVEERDAGMARVRIVFSVGSSATGQLASSGEKAILGRGIYDTFFSRPQEEVGQRPMPRQRHQTDLAVRTLSGLHRPLAPLLIGSRRGAPLRSKQEPPLPTGC